MSARTSTAPPKTPTLTRANCGPDFDATPVTKLQQAGVIAHQLKMIEVYFWRWVGDQRPEFVACRGDVGGDPVTEVVEYFNVG